MTNNATKSRADYRKKFDKVGIMDIHVVRRSVSTNEIHVLMFDLG